MATSGTYTFNLDVATIIEEAYERCGVEMRTGYELITARRSLDLLLTEWANRQVNLWKVSEATLALSDGDNDYTLPAGSVDVLDAVCRDSNNTDTEMERMSIEEYLNQPTKTTEGRPTHFVVYRNVSSNELKVWPTPDQSYTLVYYHMRYIEDAGVPTNNVDVPRRFLPALTSGLAWYLARKKPARYQMDENGRRQLTDGVDPRVVARLKEDYDRDFQLAYEEDRDRSSFYAVPMVGRI